MGSLNLAMLPCVSSASPSDALVAFRTCASFWHLSFVVIASSNSNSWNVVHATPILPNRPQQRSASWTPTGIAELVAIILADLTWHIGLRRLSVIWFRLLRPTSFYKSQDLSLRTSLHLLAHLFDVSSKRPNLWFSST